ncbi:choice-of-anchor J domain-containing protein [Winogradskyella wichelsiae]|uniref:choice-of-anchor J domain-containing protein n=1 Tax=Winogradskyella wichelsiae TaxID=2697007 RepID=UPI003EF72DEC
MKKITLLLFTILICSTSFAQTNLFFDDFESYTDFAISDVGSWTLLDVDGFNTYGFTGVTFPESGSPKAFQVFNSTATVAPLTPDEASDWAGYNSVKGMVCMAAVPDAAGNGNDDWLITPQIALATSGNNLSFRYKACDAAYSNEMFTVSVSTTDTDPGSFTIISANPESVPSNDITWKEFTYDLSTYDGQDVYIGINCISNDQFGFMVDDFSVDTTLSVDQFDLDTFTHHYNKTLKTLTIESSSMVMTSIEIYSILGQSVITSPLYSTTESIDLSSLNDGVYLAKININNNFTTIKFIKN